MLYDCTHIPTVIYCFEMDFTNILRVHLLVGVYDGESRNEPGLYVCGRRARVQLFYAAGSPRTCYSPHCISILV